MGDVPPEVIEQISSFHTTLDATEEALKDHIQKQALWSEDESVPALSKARLELTSIYAANSLFWVYLACHGHRPKELDTLMKELERIKEYMGRLKELEDRELAPKLNPGAAKAFVRNALFDVDEANAARKESEAPAADSPSPRKAAKRKRQK